MQLSDRLLVQHVWAPGACPACVRALTYIHVGKTPLHIKITIIIKVHARI